jgi:hypothetical protein
MVSWLVGLDGLRTMDQVDAQLPIPAVDAARMLRAGMQAVAIEDASCMPDAWRWASVAERDSASGIARRRPVPTAAWLAPTWP